MSVALRQVGQGCWWQAGTKQEGEMVRQEWGMPCFFRLLPALLALTSLGTQESWDAGQVLDAQAVSLAVQFWGTLGGCEHAGSSWNNL